MNLSTIVVAHSSPLWSTIKNVGAIIASIASSAALVIGALNRGKIQQVHGVVNGQFSRKVDELADVTQELRQAKEQLTTALATNPTPTQGPGSNGDQAGP